MFFDNYSILPFGNAKQDFKMTKINFQIIGKETKKNKFLFLNYKKKYFSR